MIQNKFIPHVQPYEFEALCFGDLETLFRDPEINKDADKIRKILREYNYNPEEINNKEYPAEKLKKSSYQKGSSIFASNCRIDEIRKTCPHFNEWLIKLEDIVKNSSDK